MKFIDLFSGIGGFRLGMEMAGHRCVGHCEIDKFANKMYKAMHSPGEGEWYAKDIRDVRELPDADCYCGGFPCQSFSVAGRRGGFQDTRGTLFFEIMRLARARKPKYLFLENVSGLLSHDAGGTFATILQTFTDSGYDVQWQVLNSKDFGVPQNRERVFFIGHLRGQPRPQVFPLRGTNEKTLEQLIGGSQGYRVYDITGTSVTLVSQAGGMGANTGLYMIPTKIYSDSGQGRKWRGQDFVSALRVGGDVQCVEVRLVLTPDRAEKRQNGRRFKEEVEIANTLQVAGPSMGCGNNNPVTGVMITDQCKEKMLFKCDCGCESIIYDLSEKCPHCNSIRKGTVTYLNQRAILSPKRTEYGKQICKNYESGEIKESRHNTTKSEQRTDGVSNTLSTVQKDNLLLDGVKIRRLTPREYFRLQGFPDEYFDRAKAVASDTQLYKAAGNAVTVNVIYEIAKRL